MDHYGFLQLIKNYAKTIVFIDEKKLPQEAFYIVQQSYRKAKSAKIYSKNHIS